MLSNKLQRLPWSISTADIYSQAKSQILVKYFDSNLADSQLFGIADEEAATISQKAAAFREASSFFILKQNGLAYGVGLRGLPFL